VIVGASNPADQAAVAAYFNPIDELVIKQPLLHLWSLSIENGLCLGLFEKWLRSDEGLNGGDEVRASTVAGCPSPRRS
jgi:hypothetical protein